MDWDEPLTETPMVSVIMNCYNSDEYLKEAIDSVLAQSYKNWGIVFWDNQSTDDSAKIFNSYDDERLRYFLAPEFTKLGQARNLAISQALGDWLGFLDCDDVWVKTKLEKQVQLFTKGKPLIYSRFRFIDQDNTIQIEKLVFLKSIANTLKTGMNILGVDTPEKM